MDCLSACLFVLSGRKAALQSRAIMVPVCRTHCPTACAEQSSAAALLAMMVQGGVLASVAGQEPCFCSLIKNIPLTWASCTSSSDRTSFTSFFKISFLGQGIRNLEVTGCCHGPMDCGRKVSVLGGGKLCGPEGCCTGEGGMFLSWSPFVSSEGNQAWRRGPTGAGTLLKHLLLTL